MLGLVPLLALTACGDDSQGDGSGSGSSAETSTQTSTQTETSMQAETSTQAESSTQTETSTQTADLTIRYTLEAGVSCDQDGVESILVHLGEDGAAGTASMPCDDAGGEIVLTAIDPGSYDLLVVGVDANTTAVLGNASGDEHVELVAGEDHVVDVVLGLVLAHLEVALVVTADGFPVQCNSPQPIMIRGLHVEAWDLANADLLASHDFDSCDFDGLEPVPDMDRQINGRHFDGVVIQPLDANGGAVGSSYELPLGGPVGAGQLVQVSVECEDDACVVERLE